jgi:hypothetical protein
MDHLDGLAWRTSSYSGSNGGNCIQVAATMNTVAVRDSKDPHGHVLAFGAQDWKRFADRLKAAAGQYLPGAGLVRDLAPS